MAGLQLKHTVVLAALQRPAATEEVNCLADYPEFLLNGMVQLAAHVL
jgi:hypothetical protein